MPERVLVVEDDQELRALLEDILVDAGYAVDAYPAAEPALAALAAGTGADLVVTDLMMPGMGGEALLRAVRDRHPTLNVVVITAFGSIESAIHMIKAGAFDYVTKPFGADELLLAVQRGLDDSRARRQAQHAPAAHIPGFLGTSTAVRALTDLVTRAGRSRHPVLITGETGTGKELVARAIHTVSGRGPFVPINCGAIPDQLLESELFGHERGAFTGADRARPGLLETAHAGSAFLDEIGDLPAPLQPKLLRVLEDGEVRRLGANAGRPLDFRLIAATNRDLEAQVRDGTFREDLLWRVNVLHLHIPPLRERLEDVPALAEHFLVHATDPGASARHIAPDAMARLVAYPWPGNVRELRNAIQRAAALAPGDTIRPEDLPPRLQGVTRAAPEARPMTMRELERTYILEVLRQADGNRTRAAELLGLDRKTLYRKLQEYQVPDAD